VASRYKGLQCGKVGRDTDENVGPCSNPRTFPRIRVGNTQEHRESGASSTLNSMEKQQVKMLEEQRVEWLLSHERHNGRRIKREQMWEH
jgi:hypothetical protein